MHELSIAEELLDIIFKNAGKAGISKVSVVNLKIGEYAGIYPDSLEFAFEVLSQEKMTQGARVNIERIAPRFICQKCQSIVSRDKEKCEHCGSEEITMQGGDELEIVSFEGD